jgi:hypothetical protein
MIYMSKITLTCTFASIAEIYILVKMGIDVYNERSGYQRQPELTGHRREVC